jgi:hypothetical protein
MVARPGQSIEHAALIPQNHKRYRTAPGRGKDCKTLRFGFELTFQISRKSLMDKNLYAFRRQFNPGSSIAFLQVGRDSRIVRRFP